VDIATVWVWLHVSSHISIRIFKVLGCGHTTKSLEKNENEINGTINNREEN
jgi:hypothetical protein